MAAVKFVYWQEKDFWIGYLQDYPDYLTQGSSFEDLKENLLDLYKDICLSAQPRCGEDAGDLKIINTHAAELNEEAADVLEYQALLDFDQVTDHP